MCSCLRVVLSTDKVKKILSFFYYHPDNNPKTTYIYTYTLGQDLPDCTIVLTKMRWFSASNQERFESHNKAIPVLRQVYRRSIVGLS